MSQTSLDDVLTAIGSPVDMLRNSQIGPYAFPVVRHEFSNWRDEQRSWRETCALFDQSHHMTDLYVKGPDALRLFSDLGVNSFKNFRVNRPNSSSWICDDAENYPLLSLMVKGDVSTLGFMYKEGEPGLISHGNIPGVDPSESTIFGLVEIVREDVEVQIDALLPFSAALAAAQEFFTSKQLPKSVEWVEL